ncbi:uncharacterized protein LOC108195331 [Daucus carota subsp. sativus]|uniref:uncharacterized protein LOC108195331 n=1 Tax=Daucus carota subsp. sativus TaxID=79200 RepID=UPI003083681A
MADFYFTMNRDQPLRKLMLAFCERRKQGDYRSLRYHLNGDRIRGHQTPNELELENDDVIDAWIEQMGGAGFSWCLKHESLLWSSICQLKNVGVKDLKVSQPTPFDDQVKVMSSLENVKESYFDKDGCTVVERLEAVGNQVP